MAKLLKRLNPEISVYKDRRFEGDEADWERALRTSTTLYVGNLAFFTREEQIYEVFSKCGFIERIIMGLDKHKKTPCGFCFVIFYTRSEAEAAVRYLNGTIVDDRPIRVDHDWGFVDGRQWGRGRSGGQVRDEFRQDYDPGRGGFGIQAQNEWARTMSTAQGGMGFDSGSRGRNSLGGGGDYRDGDSKRRRLDGGGGYRDGGGMRGGQDRRAADENPRFRSDRKRGRDSDEDEDR